MFSRAGRAMATLYIAAVVGIRFPGSAWSSANAAPALPSFPRDFQCETSLPNCIYVSMHRYFDRISIYTPIQTRHFRFPVETTRNNLAYKPEVQHGCMTYVLLNQFSRNRRKITWDKTVLLPLKYI